MTKYLLTACALNIIAAFSFVASTLSGHLMIGAAVWGIMGYAIFYLGAMEGKAIVGTKENNE